MNKKHFKINDTTGLAVILKAGSSTFGKAVADAYHPDVAGAPISYPDDGKGANRLGWQGVCPKIENPQNSYAAIREPIDRFRSALAQIQRTDVDAVLDGLEAGEKVNVHFHSQAYKIQDGTKLYKFPTDLEQLASDLGLEYPLPQINEGAVTNPPKPELTSEQEARVAAIYADDIALFNSITEAGTIYSTPATDEAKQAKLAELAAARYAEEVGGIVLDGMPVRTDERTRSLLASGMAEVRNDPNFTVQNWKLGTGQFIDLDAAQITAIYESVEAHIAAVFAKERTLSNQVVAATTQAELDAINW
jgi:hypothetical protein